MDAASVGLPIQDFAEPSDKVLEGDLVRVPDVSGMSESDALQQPDRRRFQRLGRRERLLQPLAGRHRLHLPRSRVQGDARLGRHAEPVGRVRARSPLRRPAPPPAPKKPDTPK